MSTRGVLIWLVLALALGALTWFLLRVAPGTAQSTAEVFAPGEQVVPVATSRVEAFAISHGGVVQRVSRQQRTGAWILTIEPGQLDDLGTPIEWELVASNVQGFLRLLTGAVSVAAPSEPVRLGERDTTLVLNLAPGEGLMEIVIRFAERTLGGTGAVLVEMTDASGVTMAKTGIVDDRLHRSVRDPGPRAWRETVPFGGLAGRIARVSLQSEQRETLSIGRVAGKWSVREPVAGPANESKVQRLLTTITGIRVVEFLDAATVSVSTGLEKPRAVMTIETDLDHGGQGRGSVRELAIGVARDAGGVNVYATIDENRLVVIDASALGELSMDVADYLWPWPSAIRASEVGAMLITVESGDGAGRALGVRRSLERWVERLDADSNGGVEDRPLVGDEAHAVAATLEFLTGPAREDSPVMGLLQVLRTKFEAPEGYQRLGTVRLLSFGDSLLDEIELGMTSPSELVLRSGNIYRTVPAMSLPPTIRDLLRPVDREPSERAMPPGDGPDAVK